MGMTESGYIKQTAYDPLFSMSSSGWLEVEEDKSTTGESEPFWTTSRCHRLLRPLSSKIAMLRKQKLLGLKELSNPSQDTSNSTDPDLSTWAPHRSKRHDLEFGVHDVSPKGRVDWASNPRTRKGPRRTYSARSKSEVPKSDTFSTSKPTPRTSAEAILGLIDEKSPSFSCLRDGYGGLALDGLSDDETVKCPSAEPGPSEWHVGIGSRTPLRAAFTKLTKKLSPVNWKTLDGLYDSLTAILRVTADEKSLVVPYAHKTNRIVKEVIPRLIGRNGRRPLHPGSSIAQRAFPNPVYAKEQRLRSLFETCLREIPTLIIKEQRALEIQDLDNDVDVSSAMYSDLEQLNPLDTAGWKPLKKMVRAHGIAILADAIKESLINLPIARALMVVCLEQGAYNEARTIVEAMMTVMEPLPKPESLDSLLFSYNTSVTLQAMHTILLKSQSYRFGYIQLAKLFETGILPIEWIPTLDMVEFWKKVIIDVTQGKPDAAEAALLLRTVFALTYVSTGRPVTESIHELRIRTTQSEHPNRRKCEDKTPLDSGNDDGVESLAKSTTNLLSSLLTVLVAVALLEPPRTSALHQICQQAQQLSELARDQPRRGHPYDPNPNQLSLSLLASAISSGEIDSQCQYVLAHGLSQTTSDFAVTAGSFMCNVAECCGRVTAKDPYEHLHYIMKRLGSRIVIHSEHAALRVTYNAACVAAAFGLAEKSGLPKHMERALSLDQRLQGNNAEHAFRTPGTTPAQRRYPRNGFRWEEGISEWVAQTPVGSFDIQKACNKNCEKSGDEDSKQDPTTEPGVQDVECLGEASPCTKKRTATEAVERLTGRVEQSGPFSNSIERPLKRRRGRPRKGSFQADCRYTKL